MPCVKAKPSLSANQTEVIFLWEVTEDALRSRPLFLSSAHLLPPLHSEIMSNRLANSGGFVIYRNWTVQMYRWECEHVCMLCNTVDIENEFHFLSTLIQEACTIVWFGEGGVLHQISCTQAQHVKIYLDPIGSKVL